MNSSISLNDSWNKNLSTHTSFIFSLILFLAYAIIFLIGFITNIFVIIVIIKCRRMRTLTNRFLLNLAISDLLATLICLPPTAYHHYDKRWIFGEFLCRFVPFIQGTSVAVSIFTLMAVSIDRFIAIHKPIHSKLLCTPTRILVTIGMTWIASFLLMIPLIVHHRIVDPFDVTLKACAEEWQQNMNARLVYDFVLLFVLFIIPLTLMTYCYIRISLSLWFIDSNVRSSIASSLSSNLHPGRISNLSDELQQLDVNEGRLLPSQKNRPYYIHYHKNFDHDLKRKTQQHPLQQNEQPEELHSLMNPSGSKSGIDSARRNLNMNETKPKSFSITATTITTMGTSSRRSSSLIGRRLGDNGYESMNLNKPIVGQTRTTPTGNRSSSGSHHSAVVRSSLTSLQSHHRIHGSTSLNINGNTNRSVVDFERVSRFLQSRRRVVKLLITLVVVFFITRLPLHILSIYIDITSSTFLPVNTYRNMNRSGTMEEAAAILSSNAVSAERKMALVLYVNPILQLMSLSNSAINPLCYCMMSHAVKHIFTLIRQRFRRRGQKKASTSGLVHRGLRMNPLMKVTPPQRHSFPMEEILH